MDYLKSTKSESAPMSLFSHKDACKHTFKAGMKVECTDLMDPRLVCVGTISRVVGRLLKVRKENISEDFEISDHFRFTLMVGKRIMTSGWIVRV
jgi:hypothetical protein